MGISESNIVNAKFTALLVGTIALAFIIDWLARRLLLGWIDSFTRKTRSKFDDALRENRFFRSIAHLVPIVFLQYALPVVFEDYPILYPFLTTFLEILVIIGVLIIIGAFLKGLGLYSKQMTYLRDKPIDSYVQLGMIINFGIGAVFILSILLGKSLPYLFGTLGAASAVLLLIFKDSILGFVASIQVSANDIVRIGDWIENPKYGADGTIIQINLTTVKVQNWDKTITTIPTYSLISDAFKNWRGMTESGGRRIKRSIYFNTESFEFLDDAALERLKKMPLLADYLAEKQAEIFRFNAETAAGKSPQKYARRLTNIGTFRAYAKAYLQNHPGINRGMTLMVRQLQPEEYGLPLQIYCFTNTTEWIAYEGIQADIFDHLLTIAPRFALEVFQKPSGRDFQGLRRAAIHKNDDHSAE